MDDDGKCVRCEGVEGLRGFVKDHQQYAMIKHHLSRWANHSHTLTCTSHMLTSTHPHRHTPLIFILHILSLTLSLPHPYIPSQSLHPGEPAVQLDLWSSSVTAEPRFSLFVVDTPRRKAKNGPFAIFIAPQGRWGDQYCARCNNYIPLSVLY